MTTMTLYTGGGVSLSPENGEGRIVSNYVRLVADEGKMLKKDDTTAVCVDVPTTDVSNWTEVDYVDPDPDEEAEISDYEQELADLGVRFE